MRHWTDSVFVRTLSWFTDSYINTAINRISPSYFTSLVQLRFDIIHNKRICYVMLCYVIHNINLVWLHVHHDVYTRKPL